MDLNRSYKVKICDHNRYSVFNDTVKIYREIVSFFIDVCLAEWDTISKAGNLNYKLACVEKLTVTTSGRPVVSYDFAKASDKFYKVPAYWRRVAINNAISKVQSYKSNLANWEREDPKTRGKKPTISITSSDFPALYHKQIFIRENDNTAKVKVRIRNTWDWVTVNLKPSDVRYIQRYCKNAKECSPVLEKHGKLWYLKFCYESKVDLRDTPLQDRTALAVDLGVNSACVCSVMRSNGTVIGRHFCSLPIEEDCLKHQLAYINKVKSTGVKRIPRLFSRLKGINQDIAQKTASFIVGIAKWYDVDVIVFEHLDLQGKKHGRMKQRLHHWKANKVQEIVSNQAHLLGMRISTVNPYGTSRLAFDGSGKVLRGKEAGLQTYSLCRFSTGKIYNCDLNASYNIGARYFLREYEKSMSERMWSALQTKVSELQKRTTSTLSTLIKLYAVMQDENLMCG